MYSQKIGRVPALVVLTILVVVYTFLPLSSLSTPENSSGSYPLTK